MKRLLVFQHVAHEPLGTVLPLLRHSGFRIRYANFGRPPYPSVHVNKYDGLVILGGPMGVYEADKFPHLTDEIRHIKEAIALDKPVLGICLGAQLIAAALGAEVKPQKTPEIGWYDVSLTDEGKKDPILRELAATEKIFQWHGDTFSLPTGALWLAKTEACRHQAFRYGDRVYGFQFHLEVDEPMIERWLKLPVNSEQLCAMGDPEIAAKIKAETHLHIAHLKHLSHKVFSRYIELFSLKGRTTVLGSGHR